MMDILQPTKMFPPWPLMWILIPTRHSLCNSMNSSKTALLLTGLELTQFSANTYVCTTITSTQFRECKNRAELSFVASMSTMICNLTTHCSPSYSFDGDQFLLFYRRDLQVKDGWDVPKTWDELVEVAGKSCVPFDDCCIFFLTG